jgi:hypothetical protein
MRLRRRAPHPDMELLPSAELSPEARLLLAVLLRALMDAHDSPEARAWVESPAFAELCSLVDLCPERLRRLAASASLKTLRSLLRKT